MLLEQKEGSSKALKVQKKKKTPKNVIAENNKGAYKNWEKKREMGFS